MNYFLAFSKLARIQCVFWGNPITSGIDTIDYFMTADATENENRQIHTHYSEQAVLLGGQVWRCLSVAPLQESLVLSEIFVFAGHLV